MRRFLQDHPGAMYLTVVLVLAAIDVVSYAVGMTSLPELVRGLVKDVVLFGLAYLLERVTSGRR